MAELINEILQYTKTGPNRLAAMVSALERIDRHGIAGDIVECGVWRAGNIILARKLSPRRVCWLYDTFSGMTEPGEFDVKRSGARAIDRYRKNWAAVSVEEVRAFMQETGTLDDEYLRFIAGPVEQTLLQDSNLPERIALLRLDTDWYDSTKIEIETLYPRLSPGGVLIVDDYGHWMGAKKAVDEYLPGCQLEMIDYSAAMLVKPC